MYLLGTRDKRTNTITMVLDYRETKTQGERLDESNGHINIELQPS